MSADIITSIIIGITSIIGSLLTFAGVVVSNNKSNQKIESDLKTAQVVTDTKIDNLKEQVEKHNKVIERVYLLEKDNEVKKEKIKVINHRIDDLEEHHK